MTTTVLFALTLLAISTMAEYTNPEETTTTCEAPKAAKIQHTGKPHTPSFSIKRA